MSDNRRNEESESNGPSTKAGSGSSSDQDSNNNERTSDLCIHLEWRNVCVSVPSDEGAKNSFK
jgi:hypothetical protein